MTWASANASIRRGGAAALKAGGEQLLAASTKVAPIEHDTLIKSAKVSVDYPAAAVSYDTPYAVLQHERMDERHDPGREAKYLERPLHTEAPAIARTMAGELRRATG